MPEVVGIGSSSQKYQGSFQLNQARIPQAGQSWSHENALYECVAPPPNTKTTPGDSIALGQAYWRTLISPIEASGNQPTIIPAPTFTL